MKNSRNLPLLIVVGSTASGKTAASIEIAKKLRKKGISVEIISADSRTIYRGMNVGTAKIRENEMAGIPHFGLDLIDPDEKFTVADFQKYAKNKIREIRARGNLPILVGGSGLYVDSVIFDYDFGGESSRKTDLKFREKLNKKSVQELQKIIIEHKILMPENRENKRYLARAIEKNHENTVENNTTNNRDNIRENTIIVGILVEKNELRARIKKRIQKMFSDEDLARETNEIFAKYAPEFREKVERKSWTKNDFAKLPEALKSNIYLYKLRKMAGELSRNEAENLAEIDDWHLAKRQKTWFQRNKFIKWKNLDEIADFAVAEISRKIKN